MLDAEKFELCAITRAVRERWPFLVCATSLLLVMPGVAISDDSTQSLKSPKSTQSVDLIDLSQFDKDSLQLKMDSLALPTCTPAVLVSCGWTVLSLVHSRPTANSMRSKPATAEPALSGQRQMDQTKLGKRFSDKVPAGFEQFANLQQLEVDVHVENVQPFRAGISFNSSSFTFDDPETVAETIATLGVGTAAELELFISADHPVSADDVCIDDGGPEDCVTREPLPYAILPNLSDERVDLVVRLSLRPVQNDFDNRLPAARKGLSWQSSVRGTTAALSKQSTSTDVQANASVSYGPGGVFASTSHSSTDDSTRVNELFFSHQFAEHQTRIGTVAYQSSGLLLNQRLIGLDWSRSLNTVTDRQGLFSTLVEVDLSTRSVVQLVVDGVVYQSETLDAGRQRLNTARLPGGTYELEIRIRDVTNGLRVERQIFTRTLILPPPRVALYGLTAASGVDKELDDGLPESDGELFVSGYLAQRLTQNVGARVEATRYADAQAAQLQLVHVGKRYQLQVEGLVGNHSALGRTLRMAYQGQRISFAVQGMRFSSDAELRTDLNLAGLFRPDVEQTGVAVGYRRGKYALNLRADRISESIDGNVEERNRFISTLQRRLFSGALRGSSLVLQYTDDDDLKEVQLRFTLYAKDGDVQHRASVLAAHDLDSTFEPEVNYSATLEPGSEDGFPDARRVIGRVETSATKSRSSLGAAVTLIDQHYDLSAGVDIIDEPQEEQADDLSFRALLTGTAQIAGNAEGYAFGRYRGNAAGVIVDVRGEPVGDQYDILVNGTRRGVGTIGSKQFIGLPSFNTHKIQLVPRSLAFNGFDNDIQEFTLYPGNVHRVQVEAENRYLLITSIVDSKQKPLTNVVINNDQERYFVLDDGIVQIEVRALDELDIDLSDGSQCSVTVPDPQGEDVFIQPVPLICL